MNTDLNLRTLNPELCPDFDFTKVVIDRKTVLGKGSYATVHPGMTDDKIYAVKIINKKSIEQKYLEVIKLEGAIAMEVDHPNVVKSYCFIETPNEIRLYMDYIPGGNLIEYFNNNKVNECQIFQIFDQMFDAVIYLHSIHIVHGDIKLENFLINDGRVYLSDFGFSYYRDPNGPLSTRFLGSRMYASPQILRNIPNSGFNNDRWALGVCLYAMITGKFPFNEESVKYALHGSYYDQEAVPDYLISFFNDILAFGDYGMIKIRLYKEHRWMENWRNFLENNTCDQYDPEFNNPQLQPIPQYEWSDNVDTKDLFFS